MALTACLTCAHGLNLSALNLDVHMTNSVPERPQLIVVVDMRVWLRVGQCGLRAWGACDAPSNEPLACEAVGWVTGEVCKLTNLRCAGAHHVL